MSMEAPNKTEEIENEIIAQSPNNHVYKKEHMFHFNTFEDANEFYVNMADRLSLTDDTYRNERYIQLYNNNVPEFTKEVYLDLITNFNIF